MVIASDKHATYRCLTHYLKSLRAILPKPEKIHLAMQRIITTLCLVCGLVTMAFAQSPVGVWKTIDDETNQAKSHVEIYEQDGKLYGKIVKIMDPAKQEAVCDKCDGDMKNQRIMGMVILRDLEKDGKYYEDGTILDPNKGKEYSCYIELKGADKLKVRGYMGISALGRTQYWYRVK